MSERSANWFLRARLKTRQLLLLVALDDEGTIFQAAERLNMTQPAASKLLKDLEEALGVDLFERQPRGMKPTWYGEIMVRHARMVLANLTQAHDEIEALRSGLTGQVRLGAILAACTELVPRTVARIKALHPQLQVVVHMDSSDGLHQRLNQGRLDVVIGRLFENHDKSGLDYEPLADEPICVMVRRDHPLLLQENLGLADLQQAAWILPPAGGVLRHRFDLMYREAGLEPPRNVVETSTVVVITRLLEQTDMLALVPAELARHYQDHGMGARLPADVPCRMDAYGIIRRHDHLLSPGAETLLRLLRMTARELYEPALHARHARAEVPAE